MREHWCSDHKTVFFKRGKMKTFAHPIKDEDGELTGQWCNESEPAEQDGQLEEKPPIMTKDDWVEKDRITRKSIERQTALNAAVELAKTGGLKFGQLLPSAKRFEIYLETGIIEKEVPAKSKLLDEVKKLQKAKAP